MNSVKVIGDKVLERLLEHYHAGIPFYLQSNIPLNRILSEEIFVSGDEIVDHIRESLSRKYTQQ